MNKDMLLMECRVLLDSLLQSKVAKRYLPKKMREIEDLIKKIDKAFEGDRE
ncbi:hypothetical protein [Methanocaldococcus sp.]